MFNAPCMIGQIVARRRLRRKSPLLGRNLCHPCVVIRTVEPMVRPGMGIARDFQLQGPCFRSTDVGRELNGIRDPVRLNLDIAPVDIVKRHIGKEPAIEPCAFGAKFVILRLSDEAPEVNDDVVRIHRAGLPR